MGLHTPADHWGLIRGALNAPVSWGGVHERRLCREDEGDGLFAPI